MKILISTDNFYRSHICSVLLKMTQKTYHSIAERDPDLYDYAKITFIHPVINAKCHAKVGLPFFLYTLYNTFGHYNVMSGNWKNKKWCGNTTPARRSVFTQFPVFPISTNVDITNTEC